MAEPHPRSHSEAEAAAGILPSHGISINLPDSSQHSRPPHPVKHMSAPAYQSPIRHHRRVPSKTKNVKETLNARSHYGSSDDDGPAVHRINQYIIKQEIGRGSFGAVHLAVDQFDHEYAVKEFSKSRLRKRAQSNLLRKPNQGRKPGHLAAGAGFNSPLHRLSSSDRMDQQASNNSLNLIREEIAIMKKLNHNNLVNLIEVLDDPQEDSLYMVLEMCKKGVVMKVGLEERAEPYEEEACRCWFRDMILGIEYLHAQGIIHRDIKPDNCLITNDDVLKIVDFGVSEMFEKQSEMATAKSAGSPAFMPPELCVAKHGQVSGRAADIWSMGVTLYCLRYGHIPFEKAGMLELYESIRYDDLAIDEEKDENFADLMQRLLEKDPEKRITMEQIRTHPWVTKKGTDPLLSAEDNCADLVEPPTDAEMDLAITGNMGHLLIVMKAVKRFKKLLTGRRPSTMEGIFGRQSRLVAPPQSIRGSGSRSQDVHDRRPMNRLLATEGVHHEVDVDDDMDKLPHELDKVLLKDPDDKRPTKDDATGHDKNDDKTKATPDHIFPTSHESKAHFNQRQETSAHHPHDDNPQVHRSFTFPAQDHAKGHAHDPLSDTLFLGLGAGFYPAEDPPSDEDVTKGPVVVSESPPAVEINMFENAYQDEMKRIQERKGEDAGIYLTRRVEHREDLRSHPKVLDAPREAVAGLASKFGAFAGKTSGGGHGLGGGGLAGLVKQAKEQEKEKGHQGEESGECDEPPLQAPKFDGTEDAKLKGESPPSSPAGTTTTTVDAATDLDAHNGAMPGMPGGFPLTPGLANGPGV